MAFIFLDTGDLKDSEIFLNLRQTNPGNEEKKSVPAYLFGICDIKTGIQMGEIALRVGYNERIFYGGNIGYGVNPEYRGHHYAAKACIILKNLARKHGMDKLIITCNPDNIASRKTCEATRAEFRCIVDLPESNDMYRDGERQKCIYEIML